MFDCAEGEKQSRRARGGVLGDHYLRGFDDGWDIISYFEAQVFGRRSGDGGIDA